MPVAAWTLFSPFHTIFVFVCTSFAFRGLFRISRMTSMLHLPSLDHAVVPRHHGCGCQMTFCRASLKVVATISNAADHYRHGWLYRICRAWQEKRGQSIDKLASFYKQIWPLDITTLSPEYPACLFLFAPTERLHNRQPTTRHQHHRAKSGTQHRWQFLPRMPCAPGELDICYSRELSVSFCTCTFGRRL